MGNATSSDSEHSVSDSKSMNLDKSVPLRTPAQPSNQGSTVSDVNSRHIKSHENWSLNESSAFRAHDFDQNQQHNQTRNSNGHSVAVYNSENQNNDSLQQYIETPYQQPVPLTVLAKQLSSPVNNDDTAVTMLSQSFASSSVSHTAAEPVVEAVASETVASEPVASEPAASEPGSPELISPETASPTALSPYRARVNRRRIGGDEEEDSTMAFLRQVEASLQLNGNSASLAAVPAPATPARPANHSRTSSYTTPARPPPIVPPSPTVARSPAHSATHARHTSYGDSPLMRSSGQPYGRDSGSRLTRTPMDARGRNTGNGYSLASQPGTPASRAQPAALPTTGDMLDMLVASRSAKAATPGLGLASMRRTNGTAGGSPTHAYGAPTTSGMTRTPTNASLGSIRGGMGAAGLNMMRTPEVTPRTRDSGRGDPHKESKELLSSIPRRRASPTPAEDDSLLLPKVLELAMLEQALQRDLDEDDALDEQLKQTARRVAALEKAASDARARRAKRKKKRLEMEEDSAFAA